MVMVKRQTHALISAVRQESERLLQPVVGEPVGVVGKTQPAHVTDLRCASRRANRHPAARSAAFTLDPDAASIPASSGMSPSTPVPTTRWKFAALGSRAAASSASPILAACTPNNPIATPQRTEFGSLSDLLVPDLRRANLAAAALTAAVPATAPSATAGVPPRASCLLTVVIRKV